jgi:hypothetical protein
MKYGRIMETAKKRLDEKSSPVHCHYYCENCGGTFSTYYKGGTFKVVSTHEDYDGHCVCCGCSGCLIEFKCIKIDSI